ncbi:acyl-CoA/acyl-ACP dehydrogenase [Nocardioides sp. ChNu-153]|uniref:acyl-CoA dehydrogenase family protein n=1 Tax=Nocardioides sp. ChNu-153 TaxID=2779364 RepID=UPI00264AE609|nr:acyl-CoA dehydrogenase family protein [Nocardioides sp. ChNu-153]MDN7120058.1 acyl-CoA/acyl-ACP dehydrogenase [Nocardioides sp. ChNu-153]
MTTHAVPDLLDSEVVSDLRAAVRDLLADRCPVGAVTACYDGDRSLVAPLWRAVGVDLGLAGLLVDEDRGGHGASLREAAAVAEELAAAVAPVPFVTSAVVATTVLAHAGTPEADRLLADLAGGQVTASLVVPWTTAPEGRVPAVGARVAVRSVAGALEAHVLLVPTGAGDALELRAVPVGDGVTVEPVVSLDMTRQLADVTVDAAALAAAPVVATDARDALRAGLRAGTAVLAAEQVGLARRCLVDTVAYLQQRRQFGRVLGGFQALKHRLADVYVEVESMGAAAAFAVGTLADVDDDLEQALVTAVAAAACSDTAVRVAEEMVQLHAGLAMTWEHPAHLLLKRAKSDQLALGSPERHRAVVARLADLDPPGTRLG